MRHKRVQLNTVKRSWMTAKELLLVVLVGALAALAIYSEVDQTGLGLVDDIAYASTPPVILQFSEGVLQEEAYLDLNVPSSGLAPDTQVSASLFDPTRPPAVTDFRALNGRVGAEVSLFWEMPDGVTGVDILRSERSEGSSSETSVASALTTTSFTDTDVANGKTYTYRAVATVETEDGVYRAAETPTAVVRVEDTIAPGAPQAVTVSSVVTDDSTGLLVQWENPRDEDLQSVRVYRSTQYGVRGDVVATLASTKEPMYTDTTVEPNTTYYYTVVALDAVGNASAEDFQLPAPGNSTPFTPFPDLTESTDEDEG